jgi:pyridoxal 5'-phosphate synthase pdxS subunit
MRAVQKGIRELAGMREDELFAAAKELRAPLDVVRQTAELNSLPVPNFSAGGVATPADASLMRQLGAEAVFVGSGIFKSENPARYAEAIVKAATHYDNPEILAEVSSGLGAPMLGQSLGEIPPEERLAVRGW